MMDIDKFSRSIGLLGEDYFIKHQNITFLIAGLGGVGGTVFEALVRTGFTNFIIVDRDIVAASNMNRQLLYLDEDIGQPKVEIAKRRALAINKDVNITTYQDDVMKLLPIKCDYVIDCIDDIKAKVALIKYARENNIPLITSMGMANKVDPSLIRVATINKSTVDPLAKKLRYELKSQIVNYQDIPCVYSIEPPQKDGTKLNSLMSVTSVAGLYIASYVISKLRDK